MMSLDDHRKSGHIESTQSWRCYLLVSNFLLLNFGLMLYVMNFTARQLSECYENNCNREKNYKTVFF